MLIFDTGTIGSWAEQAIKTHSVRGAAFPTQGCKLYVRVHGVRCFFALFLRDARTVLETTVAVCVH